MSRTTARFVLATIAIFPATPACAQPSPPASESSAASPQAKSARRPPIVACDLLTNDEIHAAAGWQVAQRVPTVNPGPPTLSICNFMGKDLTRVITVWYGEGSGGRYKTASEMAAALGNRDGMLVRPAQPLDNLGIPATREDQRGGLVHVHAIRSDGDELTVAGPSFDVARGLFVKALARFQQK